ncbi:DUF2690 domain-containing protein [Nonomuraea angiospora]|uniref:DUF2690 domain-containing protein n=1 Tax=Nonomuraea angiospora TaxID=46172 RepID=UPI0029A0D479|nr:DUF2690 domain-containing protein [Nonomuraea angiospora]MDX3109225.1 DUF2690 domain-containing protein [Nonomuraea angiospora]
MNRSFAAAALACGLLLIAPGAYAQDGPGRGERGKSTVDAVRGCSGAGCDGADPVELHCSGDAQTVYHYSTSLGRLELRHSPGCGASWARITGAEEGTWFYVQTCNGRYAQSYRVPRGYTNAYTDMVPGYSGIRVGNLAGHSPCRGLEDSVPG